MKLLLVIATMISVSAAMAQVSSEDPNLVSSRVTEGGSTEIGIENCCQHGKNPRSLYHAGYADVGIGMHVPGGGAGSPQEAESTSKEGTR